MTKQALAELPAPTRVVTYERVSSEDQRERETIQSQRDVLDRHLSAAPDVELVGRYIDDGVSGTVPFALRPDGARLLADAERGRFHEVWVYRIDRLGRDDVDPLVVWQTLERLGVKVRSVYEGYTDPFMYHIHVAVAAQERRTFLKRSADGMNRAAKEGRYCGGIVPYGYRVEGHKNSARLAPAEGELPGCLLSEAAVIRHIYDRLAADGWSCRGIAEELNALGIPTRYVIDGRGLRGKSTQGRWGAGRIRNMVTNPTYRGHLQYGRRTAKPREQITAEVPALVSKELWNAAQETLTRNRMCAKNTHRIYLLRGVIRCGNCGRTYCGSQHRGESWYRCDGTLRRAELLGERCQAKILRGDVLECVVWDDIESFLRNPGDIVRELEAELEADPVREVRTKERVRWEKAKEEWQARRERLLELYEGGHRTKAEVEERLGPIVDSLSQASARLAALDEQELELEPLPVAADLLADIHTRLDAGLPDQERAEIVRLLVRQITVFTDIADNGKKTQRGLIEYRFPRGSATYSDMPGSRRYAFGGFRPLAPLPGPHPHHLVVIGGLWWSAGRTGQWCW